MKKQSKLLSILVAVVVFIVVILAVIIYQARFIDISYDDTTLATEIIKDAKKTKNGLTIVTQDDDRYFIPTLILNDVETSLKENDEIKIYYTSKNEVVELSVNNELIYDIQFTSNTYKQHCITSIIVILSIAVVAFLAISIIYLAYKKYNKIDRESFTKKELIRYYIIGIIGLVFGFAAGIIAAFLQESGVCPWVYVPIGLMFFPIIIVDIGYMIVLYPRAFSKEINKQIEKQSNNQIESFYLENIDCIKNRLNKYHFIKEKYYYKKYFSFTKDYVNYFFLFKRTTNLDNTVKNECELFDELYSNKKNKCLILVVSGEYNDEDLDYLKQFVLVNTMTSMLQVNEAVVLCLYDEAKKELYMIPSNIKLSFYNFGYKNIKKILAKINENNNISNKN